VVVEHRRNVMFRRIHHHLNFVNQYTMVLHRTLTQPLVHLVCRQTISHHHRSNNNNNHLVRMHLITTTLTITCQIIYRRHQHIHPWMMIKVVDRTNVDDAGYPKRDIYVHTNQK
jgi:hypothetical protein